MGDQKTRILTVYMKGNLKMVKDAATGNSDTGIYTFKVSLTTTYLKVN